MRTRAEGITKHLPYLGVAVLVLLSVSTWMNVSAARAEQTHVFLETFGSAAKPAFANAKPSKILVDQSRHDLLVDEAAVGSVGRFHLDGTPDPFSGLASNSIEGLAEDQNGDSFVAVDESEGPASGDIYVAQYATESVEVFAPTGERIGRLSGDGSGKFQPCGVTVAGNGTVYVAAFDGITRFRQIDPQTEIYQFDPTAGSPEAWASSRAIAAPATSCNLVAGVGAAAGLVFASFGEYPISDEQSGEIEEGVVALDPSSGGVIYRVASGIGIHQLAVDPVSGHLLFAEGSQDQAVIHDYVVSPRGAQRLGESRVGATEEIHGEIWAEGVAVDGTSGKVFTSSGNTGREDVYVLSHLVIVPEVKAEAASITSHTSAILRGTVDPEVVPLDECYFEYGATSAYGSVTPCEEPAAAEVPTGSGPERVHAAISGLAPESVYHFRLVAANVEPEVDTTRHSADQTLKTPSKPSIGGEWTTEASTGSATVSAEINPENAVTSYVLEWGSGESYGDETASAEIGSDGNSHTVDVTLGGLEPGATYHYRFIASNDLGEFKGPDHSFTTYRAPAAGSGCPNEIFRTESQYLLDCRAYEMVSHAQREGGDVLPMINIGSATAALDQSAASGGALTYSTYRAAEGAQSAPYAAQYLADRGAGSWQARSINPPYGAPLDPVPFLDVEFRAFSADLCRSWLLQPPNTSSPLAPGAISGYANLYRQENCGGSPTSEAVTAPNPASLRPEVAENGEFSPDLQGVSADGSLAVFAAHAKLTEGATMGKVRQVYARAEGSALQAVCVRPNGTAYGEPCGAGTTDNGQANIRTSSVSGAVSSDGARVYWTGYSTGHEEAGGIIFVRLNPGKVQSPVNGGECTQSAKACTLRVSETVSSAESRFWGASESGDQALFEIEDGGSPLDGNLYEFDVASKHSSLIAGRVLGVLGAGRDLSRIYLVSEEALAAGALVGEPNLYLYEGAGGGGTFTFVAGLSRADDIQRLPLEFSPINPQSVFHTAQVSADGEHLAFMSGARPTGYDNIDRSSGEADQEVYLYDASADGGAGNLLCASCSPANARPRGAQLPRNGGLDRWASGYIALGESQLYAPRVLVDGGDRLFFSSFESLSPQDTNDQPDVYEWEAPGSGVCTVDASSYSARDGGCVQLVSSGGSSAASVFVDSDEEGNEVFFTTEANLVPEDTGLIDIYDARVDGGFVSATAKVECEGQACQSPVAAPQTAEPGSTAGRGEGNIGPPSTPRKCAKGRRRVRHGQKVRCVKKIAGGKHHRRKKSHVHKRSKADKREGK